MNTTSGLTLRRQLTWMLAGGPDATCEHQVEELRLAHFVARIWVAQVVFSAELANVGAGVVIKLQSVQ